MNILEQARHYAQCGHPKCSNDAHQPKQIGEVHGFSASVAVSPYTEENRAAHGSITYTEECSICGSRRQVNQNGRHFEYGPWGETARDRQAKLDRDMKARMNAEDAAAAHITVKDVTDAAALCQVGHETPQWISLADVTAACTQPDGDLAKVYRGLARKIEDFRSRKIGILV